MRITGGSKRGYRLKGNIDNLGIRPARDFVREAIFNIIRDEVEGANVIDLFAGTGLVGMEALSRGGAFCLFVENNPRAAEIIRDNLERMQLRGCWQVLLQDAQRIARLLEKGDRKYNLVFIDPPYAKSDKLSAAKGVGKIFSDLAASECIESNALLVMEQEKRADDVPAIEGLELENKRTYGNAKISFVRKR